MGCGKCAFQVSLEPIANRSANGLAGGRSFADLSIDAMEAAQAVNGFEKHQFAGLPVSALELGDSNDHSNYPTL